MPRHACLSCNRKYCSEANTLCKNCELEAKIKSLDLEAERQRLVQHYLEHYETPLCARTGRQPRNDLAKPRYKLFILNRNVGKLGGNTWLHRLDVSLGYPTIDRDLKKKKSGGYEWVPAIHVHTYGWRYEDLGQYGRHLTGPCIISGDACVWLEEPYERLISEAWKQINAGADPKQVVVSA